LADPTNPMLLLFTDLDDTLFTSARKAAPTPAHVPLAYLKDGAPISYASPCQQALLAHWQAHATMIPVTARNLDAYRRVRIPFTAHAVINHGGVILLPDGSADPAWLAQSRANAAQSVAGLEALAAHLPATAALNTRLIRDYDIPFYLLMKSTSADLAPLDDAAGRLRPHLGDDYRLHRNGNNLAVLPAWLDKAHAVAHLLAKYRADHPALVSIGMGDSSSDLPYMRLCDYLLAPSASQIARQL